MTRSVPDPSDAAPCPTDLCCYGECHCAPSGGGDRRRATARRLAGAVAILAGITRGARPPS